MGPVISFLYKKQTSLELTHFKCIEEQLKKTKLRDAWVAQLFKRLPLVQVTISGSWEGAPYWVPCSAEGFSLCLFPPYLCTHALPLTNK